MTPQILTAIRHAVCAINWLRGTSEEFYAQPKRDLMEIAGTGFLVGRQTVLTCAHVVTSIQDVQRKRRGKPFAWGVQFVYPSTSGGEMTTWCRPVQKVVAIDLIDIGVLTLGGDPVATQPLTVTSWKYSPV